MSAVPTQLRAQADTRPRRARILVVDDDYDMLDILSHALLHEGYDVLTAGNGRLALEMIRQHRPDLVLTDALMPWMDGRELCRRIKDESPATQVVLMTSLYKSARHKSEAFRNFGVDGFLPKPLDLEVLLNTIGGLVEDRR
ncbi:MAG TPA: response regulator [Thermoanaerobaculia bacterium]|nr:response regulator [Thermoanaerobaculia bacterium]